MLNKRNKHKIQLIWNRIFKLISPKIIKQFIKNLSNLYKAQLNHKNQSLIHNHHPRINNNKDSFNKKYKKTKIKKRKKKK